MKKYLLSLFACTLLFLPLSPALAKLDLGKKGLDTAAVETAGYATDANGTGLAELVGTVIKTLLSFVGVIFLVLMVYAGYLWMTAQGEESQIEKAQGIIRSSVIGMVILVGAYSITAFVVPKIVEKTVAGETNTNNLGGNEYCCSICDDSGQNCVKNVTQNEQECMANAQCVHQGQYCSIQIVPAGQCTGGTDNVNCCIFTNHGVETKEEVDTEEGCDQRFNYYCSQFNDNRCNANVDYGHRFEVVPAGQCH